MIADAIAEIAAASARDADAEVEISIPGGEALAAKTLNARLGIVGGLSILGTTGIVVPYSCSAWIASIHSGIDVARAAGLTHIVGSTGANSEAAAQKLYDLPEIALIDMGDFVGGMLKYLRRHPVPRVTVAGGVAKMAKLAQGLADLHSKRGEVDLATLAKFATAAGAGEQVGARRSGGEYGGTSLCDRASRRYCARRSGCTGGAGNRNKYCRRHRYRHRGRAVRSRAESGRPRSVQGLMSLRSSAASAKPSAVAGIVQRAVAEIARAQRAADQDQRGALNPAPRQRPRRCRRACSDTTRCAGELASATTAAGQSAP